MMTPVQAMLWQIWRGWRWGLIAGWAYLLVAAVVAHMPSIILPYTSFGENALSKVGQVLAMPCMFILIHLMAVFTLPGAHDLKTKGYSPKMFVLPVRTRTLVAWAMIWGSLYLGCVWLFTATLILRPTENIVPLVWPIAALAVGLTLLQALQWMPLAQNWLGIVIAVPLVAALAMIVMLVGVFGVPEPIATGIFLALLPLTCAAGLGGVVLARRGDIFDWRLWNRLVARVNDWRKPADHPFRSAQRAQFWFECRGAAWSLPLFVAVLVPFMAMIFLPEKFLGRYIDLALAGKQLAVLLLLPAFLAGICGSQFGNPSFPFLATRPISSAALVRSKIKMALASAIAACIPVLLVGLLFFVSPSIFDSALQGARSVGAPKAAIIGLLVVVSPVLLTWKALVESLWMGLAGRPWLINTLAFGFAGMLGCGTLLSLWVLGHPEVLTLLWSLVPWLVGLMLALKLVLAAWVIYSLVRSRLVTPNAAGLMVGAWGLIVTVLCLIAVWLIPAQLLPVCSALAAVVLSVPFSRLAGAPLALEWNRHR
jgi:hypothetical protein